MIAFVLLVIFSSIFSGSMLNVSGRISTKTTLAPDIVIASDVAMKLFATVMTSSSLPIPMAFNARKMASVPFPTPMQCFAPQNAANADSNALTKGPPMKADFEMTSAIAWSISSLMLSYCAFRSTSGISSDSPLNMEVM